MRLHGEASAPVKVSRTFAVLGSKPERRGYTVPYKYCKQGLGLDMNKNEQKQSTIVLFKKKFSQESTLTPFVEKNYQLRRDSL
jgi:hypothetical protein